MKKTTKIILSILLAGLILSPADALSGIFFDDLLYLAALLYINSRESRNKRIPEDDSVYDEELL